MKRFAAVLLSVLLLVGCGGGGQSHSSTPSAIEVDPLPELTMKVVRGTVTPAGMDLEISNMSRWDIDFGEPYWLQVYDDGQWYDLTLVDEKAGMDFVAVGYGLQGGAGKSMVLTENWSHFYGELQPGTYRLLKHVTYCELGYKQRDVVLTAEFEIEK